MKKGFIKSSLIPSFGFRSLLTIILVMYLLHPLQTQIYNFLHTISHSFLSDIHHHLDAHSHNSHHSNDFLSSHQYSPKNHHLNNKEHIEEHSHKLISFLNSVLNVNNNQTQKENDFSKIKLDKHIIPKRNSILKQFEVFQFQKIWYCNSKISNVRLKVNIPPPKKITNSNI